MLPFELHHCAKAGDAAGVRRLLQDGRIDAAAVDQETPSGWTPLMLAAASPQADASLVRLLLEQGARVDHESRRLRFGHRNALACALSAGAPAKVAVLQEFRANLHYLSEGGGNALIDAVHGRDVYRDPRLLDLLRLLVEAGVDVNCTTQHQASGLRVLSRLGRFDGVRLLLEAGADAAPLGWTPLMFAVALGNQADIAEALGRDAPLEATDCWQRSAWLLAIQTGDIAKAGMLQARGADIHARGRCGTPPLFYAICCHQAAMLQWLLEIGLDPAETNEFGHTALREACVVDNADAVRLLLKVGAAVDHMMGSQTALNFTHTATVARLLLDAGANPNQLTSEARRALIGLPPETDCLPLAVTVDEFLADCQPRFGQSNPERRHSRYLEAMIRAGIRACAAAETFERKVAPLRHPVWCAERFGQSLNLLPDGRVVQIGGEHEDSYDPDFCIYNDVFVHHPDGRIDLLAYPEADFPPTDFHTATLAGEYLYLVGALGYQGRRDFGRTPVYRLHTGTFRIEAVDAAGGEAPGWIYQHRAARVGPQTIRITGGTIATLRNGEEVHVDNTRTFEFDVAERTWAVVSEASQAGYRQ